MRQGKTTTRYADAKSIIEAIGKHFHWQRDRWLFIPNLRMGTGFGGYSQPGESVEQSIDAWAMALWPSLQFKKVAYEVKVSRHDFFRELDHPEKRQAALSVSNQFYFAVPSGLVSLTEVPKEAGLIYLSDLSVGECKVIKEAPRRDGPAPSWTFIASVARRLQKVQDPGVLAMGDDDHQ